MRQIPNPRLRDLIRALVSTSPLSTWTALLIDGDYQVHQFDFPFADRGDIRYRKALQDRRRLMAKGELLATVHLGFPAGGKCKAMVEYEGEMFSLDYQVMPVWNNKQDIDFQDAVEMYRAIWTDPDEGKE